MRLSQGHHRSKVRRPCWTLHPSQQQDHQRGLWDIPGNIKSSISRNKSSPLRWGQPKTFLRGGLHRQLYPSCALCPVLDKLATKIRKEEFVEMGELLPEFWSPKAEDSEPSHDSKPRSALRLLRLGWVRYDAAFHRQANKTGRSVINSTLYTMCFAGLQDVSCASRRGTLNANMPNGATPIQTCGTSLKPLNRLCSEKAPPPSR